MTYGASQLTLEFDIEWFLADGSPAADAVDIRDEYFDEDGRGIKIYTVDTDFSKEKT